MPSLSDCMLRHFFWLISEKITVSLWLGDCRRLCCSGLNRRRNDFIPHFFCCWWWYRVFRESKRCRFSWLVLTSVFVILALRLVILTRFSEYLNWTHFSSRCFRFYSNRVSLSLWFNTMPCVTELNSNRVGCKLSQFQCVKWFDFDYDLR